MKLLKLSQMGIAHTVLPLVVIVGVGIGGVAYLVASHADTPNSTTKCINNTYGPGSSGGCVSAIQYILNGINPYFTKYAADKPPAATLTVNGKYGSVPGSTQLPPYNNTFDQVTRWQGISGVGVDGDVGPQQTWPKFCFWVTKMSDNYQAAYPKTKPTATMVDAIQSANNAGCPAIKMPT